MLAPAAAAARGQHDRYATTRVTQTDSLELAASLGIPSAVACTPAALQPAADGVPRTFDELRRTCTRLNLFDSGSGVHAVNSTQYAVPGTITRNTTAIATANGVVVPPTKCVARIPFRDNNGSVQHLVLNDTLILTDREHNLISVGSLALDMGVATYIAPGNGSSRILFPDGVQACLLNVGVLVLPDDKTPACPVVDDTSPVHGAEGRQNVSPAIVHARWNHRPRDALQRLRSALRDPPASWFAGMNKSLPHCDGCLKGHADKVPSKNEMPVA